MEHDRDAAVMCAKICRTARSAIELERANEVPGGTLKVTKDRFT